MKILNSVVPLLIFCTLECISARNLQVSKLKVENWIDIPFSEIESQCKLKDKEEIFQKSWVQYLVKRMQFMEPSQVNGESDYTWNNIYNTDMIESLKKLMKVMQDCLDEEERLDSEGIVTVMDRILKAHAMKMTKIDPMSLKDVYCMTSATHGLMSCKKMNLSGGKHQTISMFDLMMLGVVAKGVTCEAILPVAQCSMRELKNCSSEAKKLVKVLLSPAEVSVCKNYPQEEDTDFGGIGEEMNDLFRGEEEKFSSFQKLFLL